MVTWGNTLPSREQVREKKREALVRQAASEFRKRGYHATSMDDIAAALGVSKGALYRYVKSKDEVLYECFKYSEALAKLALRDAWRLDGPAAEKLRHFVVKFVTNYLNSNLAGGAMIEIDALLPHQRKSVVAGRDEVDVELKNLLAVGIADGSIREANPKLMLLALMGSINWIPSWFRDDGELSAQVLAEKMADILIDGIRSR